MSERGLPIADGAPACPFVAFEDDRDERATVPDHRHRCYADTRPTPRALAHQEAYCLSSAFPVCPTFQDWARRESARARADAQAREDANVADRASAAGAAATAGRWGAAEPAGADSLGLPDDPIEEPVADAPSEDVPDAAADPADDDGHADDEDRTDTRRRYADEEPRRNPPRDWSAPPPWLASSEAARGAGYHSDPPDFLARRSDEPGQGLAGSAADRLAGGPPPPPPSVPAGRDEPRVRPDDHEPAIEDIEHRDVQVRRRPRAYDQHLGGPSSGPDWERPRRYEAYPTIKTRVGMPEIPRIVILAGLIALAALAFFFLPAILGLGGNSGPAGSASPVTSAAPSVSFEPTPSPEPTPILYTIKKGETLSKIATAHGITLQQLLTANPTIKNPNKIVEGQQITIPTPEPEVPDEFGGSASPAASP